uniref:Silk serpin 1 n=1 Tax=Arachnocampa richardsae TaxID=270896 RepID=S4THN9_9DIPT|nr:silk serpin 1 [Arachnocampa richardsae]
MRSTICVLFSFFLFGIVVSSSPDITTSVNDFADAIFNYIQKNTKNNIVIAPVSIQAAMALADAGSRGKTTTGLDTALQLGDETVAQVIHAFHILLKSIKSANSPGNSLVFATKIFIKKGDKITKFFKNAACRFYSSVGTVDFTNVKAAVKTINKWVSKKTNKQITSIVTPANIPPGTDMLIVNAIYFQGAWAHPFKSSKTVQGPFNTSPTATKNIYMMHQTNTFPYGTSAPLDATVADFPYTQPGLSMLIILPNPVDGLQTAINTWGQVI